MGILKKTKRKITVGKNVFYWIYKIQDDSLRLIVMTDEKTRSRLVCDFSYKKLNEYFRKLAKDDDFYKDKLLLITPGVLTPYVVRQTIDYAIDAGWKPFEKGNDFVIKEIEHKIDINFWTGSTSEDRKSEIQNPKSKI